MAQGQNNKLFNEADHIKQSDFHNATINQNINDGYGNSYVAGTHFNILASDVTIIDPRPGHQPKTICPAVLYGVHSFEYVNEILGLSGKQFIITNEFPLPPSLNLKLTPGMIMKQRSDYKDELEIIQRNTDGQTQTFIYQVGSEFILDLNIDPVQSFMRNMVRRNRAARNNVRYMVKSSGVKDLNGLPILPGIIILKIDDGCVEFNRLQSPPNGTGYLITSNIYRLFPDNIDTTNIFPKFSDYIKDIQMKDNGGVINTPFGTTITGINDGSSIYNNDQWGAEDSDISTTKPQKDEDGLSRDDRSEKQPAKDTTPLKKVYCPYNADLVVYDIHNRRVHDLCGILTPEKFYDLILRINDDTKFDGFENFKCAVCELGVIAANKHLEMDNDFDALHIMTETALDKQKESVVGAFGTFAAAAGFSTDDSVNPIPPDNNPFNGITGTTNILSGTGILNTASTNTATILNSKNAGNFNTTNRQPTLPAVNPIQMTPFEKAIKLASELNKL